ncbi:MAG: hypothetical protein VYC34_05730 [Planctomycetota bacterium]|nr:hypothetical protein [Planctomycetota bacterium]
MIPPRASHDQSAVRRGFILVLILTLTLIAGLSITAAMQRHAAQARIIDRQLNEYRRHHEMFGVRAVTANWWRKLNLTEQREMAVGKSEEPFDYAFQLPGGARIQINVVDGQGTFLNNTTTIPEPAREAYEAAFARLPADARDVIRSKGPYAISVNAAPRAVLESLLADEEDAQAFADKIINAREKEPIDRTEFDSIYRTLILGEEGRSVYELITFDPVLWQLKIDVTDEQGSRRFLMTVLDKQELQWLETTPPDEEQQDAQRSRRNARSSRRR